LTDILNFLFQIFELSKDRFYFYRW
jgi:hypothetical protein